MRQRSSNLTELITWNGGAIPIRVFAIPVVFVQKWDGSADGYVNLQGGVGAD
jgi:hypothetical protein